MVGLTPVTSLSEHASLSVRSRRVAKRRSCRVEAHVDLRLELPEGRTARGVALNLSIGGMFVECDEAVAVGTPIRITCVLSPGEGPMVLPCTVRWTTVGGFGAQLGLLGARETHAIAQLIRAARADLPMHLDPMPQSGIRGR